VSNNIHEGRVWFANIFFISSLFLFLTACSAKEVELKKSTYDIAQCNKESYTPDDLKSYKALIDQGELQGYNCVALYYSRKDDLKTAEKYFKKGAEKGSIESYAQLGSLYSSAFGQPNKAIPYYTTAANAGHIKATHNLGVEYDRQLNYKQALKWYQKAADMGNTYSLLAVATVYLKQNKTQKAIETFEKVGELGDSLGYYNLGILYRKNNAIKDLDIAKGYFEKCLNLGNPDCAGGIGTVYEDKKDYNKAIEWYKKGFALGSKDSILRLGFFYWEVKKDYKQAIYWFEQGHEKLHCVSCIVAIGNIYEKSLKDYVQAIKWYKLAYQEGDSRAAYNIGLMYQDHIKDKKKAIEWYTKSLKTPYKAITEERLKELGVESEQ
jgi:uncharacterized protein